MMEFRIHDEENLKVAERYELVKERIMNMSEDKHENIPEFARDYFTAVSGFCMKLCGIMDKALDGSLYEENLETLKKYNEELFGDVTGDNYLKSYANPEYAYEMLGSDYSMLLSVLYAGIRKRIFAVYSKDLSAFTRYLELMSQVYFEMEQEECTPQAVKNCIYYNYSDYADIDNMEVVRALSDSDCSYILHVIKNMSLDDDRYMYLLGALFRIVYPVE